MTEVSSRQAIDISCDTGEDFGVYRIGIDDSIYRYLSSAHIACGFHASDPDNMRAVARCLHRRKVRIGAHPGYPDLVGFGRRKMTMSPTAITNLVLYQVGACRALVEAEGAQLQHVKVHGALYNAGEGDETIAQAIVEAVRLADDSLILVATPGSAMYQLGREQGLRVASEYFFDRAYNSDGTLVSRSEPGAVLADPEEMVFRALSALEAGSIKSVDGKQVDVAPDTLCLHGDNPTSVAGLKMLRATLNDEGIAVKPLSEIL